MKFAITELMVWSINFGAIDKLSASFTEHCPSMFWMPSASVMVWYVAEASLVSVIDVEGVE